MPKQVIRVVGNPAKVVRNGILGLAMNPGRKGKVQQTMANTAKKPGHKPGHGLVKYSGGTVSKKKKNPAMVVQHRKMRRNTGGNVGGLVIGAILTVLAAVVSKVGAQALLAEKNTGPIGYLANAGVGAALYFGASRMTRNPAVLNGIASGTVVQIVLRGVGDFTPWGEYTKNLGVGDYQAQWFVAPQVLTDPNRSAQIQVPQGWGPGPSLPPAMIAAASGAGMGGYTGGASLY